MKVLVTGANGQLGTEMRNLSSGSAGTYFFTDVTNLPGVETEYLDITDPESVSEFVSANAVDVIVNCAAYTNVERAEEEPEVASLINETAAWNLAMAALRQGATLIHVSTDYVFGGDSEAPYKEDDPTSPLGVYGKSKLAGEQRILESGCRAIIIRTAWLYSPYGRNFVKTMKALTADRDEVSVVSDQVGSPTYAADLAALILKIIEENMLSATGIYHFSDEGEISWYDFAKAISQLCGNECRIVPVSSEEFPSKVSRPHYSVLDKTKVRQSFGFEVPYWLDSLGKCIERLK